MRGLVVPRIHVFWAIRSPDERSDLRDLLQRKDCPACPPAFAGVMRPICRCNPSTTRSARGCHPCLRYDLSPISPGRTLKSLERVKGIEPSSSAWKAVALPLSYTRIPDRNQSSDGDPFARSFRPPIPDSWLVGEVGLEPTKASASGFTVRPLCRSGHSPALEPRIPQMHVLGGLWGALAV